MMRRWLIAGCNGQLGFALGRQLAASSDAEIISAVDLPEVDVSDADSVARLFEELPAPPDVVLNAAAYTHVDRCEREIDLAQRANALAPGVLADAAARCGAQFVHVSTDYVFPGDADRPYREDDAPGPRSVYGRTKLEGEERVRSVSEHFLLVRTSWVFGRGRNFLAAILDQAQQRRRGETEGPLRVVDDQRGRPTYAEDLAEGLRALVTLDAGGLVHLAGGGPVASWWDLARECLDAAGFADLEIDKLRTADLETAAPRPSYSVLDCSRADALGVSLRDWRQAVAAYLTSPEAPTLEAAT